MRSQLERDGLMVRVVPENRAVLVQGERMTEKILAGDQRSDARAGRNDDTGQREQTGDSRQG